LPLLNDGGCWGGKIALHFSQSRVGLSQTKETLVFAAVFGDAMRGRVDQVAAHVDDYRITQGHWAPFSLFPWQWLLPFSRNLASKLAVTGTSNGKNVTDRFLSQSALFNVNIEVAA